LLHLLKDEHELINAVNFVLNALDERTERISNVVDERIGNPVRRDADIVFQLFDATSYILWMGSGTEVELHTQVES